MKRGVIADQIGPRFAQEPPDAVTVVLKDKDSGQLLGVLETVESMVQGGIYNWSTGFAQMYEDQTGTKYTGCVTYEVIRGFHAKSMIGVGQ